MRVIAGEKKGMRLAAPPKGDRARPTEDRVKEAVFNILQPLRLQARCLDVFAGTGQMGIEFLSRGAAYCTFFEVSRPMARILQQNVQKTGYEAQARIVVGDFRRLLRGVQGPLDYVYLDPPFDSGLDRVAMQTLREFGILAEEGVVIVECPKTQAQEVEGYVCCFDRAYGYQSIRLYKEKKA